METHVLAGTILKNITNHKNVKPALSPKGHRRSRAADLVFAVKQKDCAALERMVENEGADPNSALKGMTPLAFAVWEGLVDCIATLLRLGADPNLRAVDNVGRMEPPLVSAIRLGHPSSICILLLDNGADPNAKDFYGHTALWAAVYARRGDIIGLVLRYGARVREWKEKIEVLPLWNECPLYQAVLQGRLLWMYLVKAGASAMAVDRDGLGPLHIAVEKGDEKMVEALVLGLGARVVPPAGRERGTWPGARVEEKLKEWLSDEMNTPAPLMRLCRHKVRICISESNGGVAVQDYVKRLPLPERMLRYILLDPLGP